MTREEAVKVFYKQYKEHNWPSSPNPKAIEINLDIFEALGIIKFDEPKKQDQ